ncbi:hypothetical protein [Chitinophaga nivalis]|uniref:Uncharacterized protein n=1 Tax=Chitinophaga nivalis TaxID=2991709 RepID=A0ABT3IPY1_9BACT|nr:hypothetical protein [Chitinophaga nivalis]MCW3464307.1 hypothetical protein [Chitinophaga nivalis]MCW3486002.1 hypothetical protein [Chitinophaga nivalis]
MLRRKHFVYLQRNVDVCNEIPEHTATAGYESRITGTPVIQSVTSATPADLFLKEKQPATHKR